MQGLAKAHKAQRERGERDNECYIDSVHKFLSGDFFDGEDRRFPGVNSVHRARIGVQRLRIEKCEGWDR